MKFISEKQASSILKVALGTGADFAELFLENTIDNSLRMVYKAFRGLPHNIGQTFFEVVS